MYYPHECPECGSDSFRRDTDVNTEILELGADGQWVVVDYEETEHDEPKHFVYCSNCYTDVRINKSGAVDTLTDEQKADYYEN